MQKKSLGKTFINLFIKLYHLICESVQVAFEISPNDRAKKRKFIFKIRPNSIRKYFFSLYWEKMTSMFYEMEFTEELKSVLKYHRDK